MANLLKEREDGSIKRRQTKMKVADLIAVYYERRAPQLAKATLYNRRKISGLLEKELGKMLLENVRTHHLADVMMKYAELREWNANSYNTMLQQVRAFLVCRRDGVPQGRSKRWSCTGSSPRRQESSGMEPGGM
ncbi:hypothetical protein OVA29_08505 [Exiguobacterium sp. SL14]|nr:hypothetical protein [Exiguobacterium sp. SL14]MCY1690698.1 hypothetical protein [Exiguobacterium sp. SL14]